MLSLQGVKWLKVITRTSSAMYKINVIKKLFVFCGYNSRIIDQVFSRNCRVLILNNRW